MATPTSKVTKDAKVTESPKHDPRQAIRQDFYFRMLISIAAAGTLAAVVNWEEKFVGASHFLFMLFWIAYPFGAYKGTLRADHDLQNQVREFLGYGDAFLIGFVITFSDFSVMPAILFSTMILSQGLVRGGLRLTGIYFAALVVGMLMACIFYSPSFHPQSSLAVSVASTVGISSYFLIYSYYLYTQITGIATRNEQIRTEQQDMRTKTWKLSRYVSPQIWQTIQSGSEVKLETKRKYLTVFFSDIKGFSELAEKVEPEQLTEMLNTYLTEMSEIIHKYGGTIDKFIGDAIMVFYGDPTTRGYKEDAVACIAMAIEMKRKMKVLQQNWISAGIDTPLEIRMGINSGYCTVGNFGTAQRLDYTLIGTEVNLASRLETAAPPGEILIANSTMTLTKDSVQCRDMGTITVKGYQVPVQVYMVTEFRKNLGGSQTYFEHRADGFSLYMDLEQLKNYDQEKIIKALLNVAAKVKNRVF